MSETTFDAKDQKLAGRILDENMEDIRKAIGTDKKIANEQQLAFAKGISYGIAITIKYMKQHRGK